MTRGFTLLETVMAAALGGMIVAVCLSVFALVDRTDSAMSRRAQQVSDLSLVHQAMQRSLMSLVMVPRAPVGINSEGGQNAAPGPGERRFVLEFADEQIDPRLLGEPRIVPVGDRVDTQRLELVLSRPPLPGLSTQRRGRETDASAGGVHGAFELRPTRPEELAGSISVRRNKPAGMSLWWMPIDTTTSRESLLVSGLSVFQWKVFRDRERVDEFHVARWHNLPAYVEVEIETIDGVYATWLFEVDSIIARPDDLIVPTQSNSEDEDEVGDDESADDDVTSFDNAGGSDLGDES